MSGGAASGTGGGLLLGIRLLHVRRNRDGSARGRPAYAELGRNSVPIEVAIRRDQEAAGRRVGARYRVAVHVVLRLIHNEVQALPPGYWAPGGPVGRLRLIFLAPGDRARHKRRAGAKGAHEGGGASEIDERRSALHVLDGRSSVFRDLTD